MPARGGPRTTFPDGRQQPRFAGVATFCRFPLIDSAPATRSTVDWAVYGVPFDGGVTYRPGARFGPRAIRDASQYIKPFHLAHGVDIAEVLSLVDAGDAPVRPYSCKETLDAVCAFAADLGDPGHTRLLAVGGDHSIAYANLKATWQRRGRPSRGLAVVHLDAHLDTVDEVWQERWGHASPFLRAFEEGLVDPSRMVSLGIRGPLNTAGEVAAARDRGTEVVTSDEWLAGAGQERLAAFCRRIASDEVYLSFDIDCVDPAFAPGTGTPCCGGFDSAGTFALLRSLKGLRIVGADVVEVLPDRDPAGTTGLLAAHIIFEILSLAAAGATGVGVKS